MICLVYVDDTLLYARNKSDIDEAIKALQDQNGCNMTLTEEDEAAGFLGVDIKPDPENGTVTLIRYGLAKKIVEALDIAGQPVAETPAEEVLVTDADGDPPDGVYSYKSVLGMLLYLSVHSRPDIVMAVSQVARFSHNPKRSHELAL